MKILALTFLAAIGLVQGIQIKENAAQPQVMAQSLSSTQSYAYPASFLGIKSFELQTPYSDAAGLIFTSGYAYQMTAYALQTYTYANSAANAYFQMSTFNGANAVEIYVPVVGVTTSGSLHPRFELREYAYSGDGYYNTPAAWGTDDSGTHNITLSGVVSHTPLSYKTTILQVFDNKYGPYVEVVADSLTGKIYYDFFDIYGNSASATLTSSFVLGTEYTIEVSISGGTIEFFMNGSTTPVSTQTGQTRTEVYFKAGNYCQSSMTTAYTVGTATVYDGVTSGYTNDYCLVYIMALSYSHVYTSVAAVGSSDCTYTY